MAEWIKSIALPVALSAILSGGTAFVQVSVQGELLKNNIAATQELSKGVNDLRVELAKMGTTYVSRDEFERRIDKLERR